MRPAIGRAQAAHCAVGRLWLEGDQCGVEVETGAVEEWCGRGRLKGEGRGELEFVGCGPDGLGASEIETEMLGTSGPLTDIEGIGETLTEEAEETFIEGIGESLTCIEGGSGALIVGMAGAELVDSGAMDLERRMVGNGLCPF